MAIPLLILRLLRLRRLSKGVKGARGIAVKIKTAKDIRDEFDALLLEAGFTQNNDGAYDEPTSEEGGSVPLALMTIGAVIAIIVITKYVFCNSDIFSKLPPLQKEEKRLEKDITKARKSIYKEKRSDKSDINLDMSSNPNDNIIGMEFQPLSRRGTYAFGTKINNPLNVRPSSSGTWKGQTGTYTSKASGTFAVFSDPYFSIRAAALAIENYSKGGWEARDEILNTYANGVGTLTIAAMLHIYAPPGENDTQNYITYVSRESGIDPYEPISMRNKTQFIKIIKAMAKMETNTVISEEYLELVWEALYNNGAVPYQSLLEQQPASATLTAEAQTITIRQSESPYNNQS